MKKSLNPAILLINKEQGISCMNIMRQCKKICNLEKIGNAGTLDEDASGLLILFANQATKIQDIFMWADKSYRFILKLNIETDSLDNVGKVIKKDNQKIELEKIKKAVTFFNNYEYNQEVPIFSAVKVGGKKLHQYAKNSEQVTLPKKRVMIKNLKIVSQINDEEFMLEARVSKGTYIRSLARDIAYHAKYIGIAKNICRTSIGNFTLSQAHKVNELSDKHLLSLEKIFSWKKVNVENKDLVFIKNNNLIKLDIEDEYCFIVHNEEILAVYKKTEKGYKGLWNYIKD